MTTLPKELFEPGVYTVEITRKNGKNYEDRLLVLAAVSASDRSDALSKVVKKNFGSSAVYRHGQISRLVGEGVENVAEPNLALTVERAECSWRQCKGHATVFDADGLPVCPNH